MTESNDSVRLHFVEGGLQAELDRLGVSRTDTCAACDTETSDADVARLIRGEDQYRTICLHCEHHYVETEELQG